jgi:D-xylose transport system substrate-binding protein
VPRFAIPVLLMAIAWAGAAAGDELVVGVSWSNFHEERWKTDEAALALALERGGARYVSADAGSSTEKQLADLEALIARGARVLVVVAQDADAALPAIRAAQREGIAVIAYDRLIESPGVVYVSFENREVGRLQARALLEQVPRGRYAFIKGAQSDPNTHTVHAGQLDVLGPAIERGDVQVVGDQFVDDWLPEVAQRTAEQILTANADRVDAFVCSNDGMAGGVVAALASQGLTGVPVSGQDGEQAALNRVARGLQAVSVWKDVRALGREAGRVALELARGAEPAAIEGVSAHRTAGGLEVPSLLLPPLAITRRNLDVVIDAGWVSREVVCRGVGDGAPDACRARP